MKLSSVSLGASRGRDRHAYQEARRYLLSLGDRGVTEELLSYYLDPRPSRLAPRTLEDAFKRLLESAQNRNMMASVIAGSIGGIDSLETVLFGFAPQQVARRYISWQELLDTIERKLYPTGKIRRAPGSLWPLFARAALSGARFLAEFSSAAELVRWIRVFDTDHRKRAALPLLLGQEIEGFGFALACDFLKELGFVNFAEPDVHVKALVKGLALAPPKADDYAVFKAVVRIAVSCSTTPYNVDKLFWLVGSGNFYAHPALGHKGRIRTDREAFIRHASRALAVA